MSTTYPAVGNVARLKGTFTDSTGAAADPTTVTVQYAPAGGAMTTVTPVRDSVGVYHYDLLLTSSGFWYYRFIGTGAVTAETEDTPLYVKPTKF